MVIPLHFLVIIIIRSADYNTKYYNGIFLLYYIIATSIVFLLTLYFQHTFYPKDGGISVC
jgi:hypothetical protein